LEDIGVISRSEGKKAAARSGNYQDNVTRPLSHDQDNNATAGVDPDAMDVDDLDGDSEPVEHVLSAVERVCGTPLYYILCILKCNLQALKDCQGCPFKSSASPSLGA
jgi:hypothetical protein